MVIRRMRPEDLEPLVAIWLAGNLDAHPFIPAEYWQAHLPMLREALPQASVWVAATDQGPLGFLGLQGDSIAGLFVAPAARGRGIGAKLLDTAKALHPLLTLGVYRQNARAVRFYRRQGFAVVEEHPAPPGGIPEYRMVWQR